LFGVFTKKPVVDNGNYRKIFQNVETCILKLGKFIQLNDIVKIVINLIDKNASKYYSNRKVYPVELKFRFYYIFQLFVKVRLYFFKTFLREKFLITLVFKFYQILLSLSPEIFYVKKLFFS